MASRDLPRKVRKPWSVMSPNNEGKGRKNIPGFSYHQGTNILVLLPEKTRNLCYKTFLYGSK